MKGWKHFQPCAAARFDKPGRGKPRRRRKMAAVVLYGQPTKKFLARARALRMRIILRPVDELPAIEPKPYVPAPAFIERMRAAQRTAR